MISLCPYQRRKRWEGGVFKTGAYHSGNALSDEVGSFDGVERAAVHAALIGDNVGAGRIRLAAVAAVLEDAVEQVDVDRVGEGKEAQGGSGNGAELHFGGLVGTGKVLLFGVGVGWGDGDLMLKAG